MLAQCSRCTQTFKTERYGQQFCPFCGAAVMIAAPEGASPGGPIPSPAAPGGPQDQDAPVDRPADHGGWFAAAVATWRQSVLSPNVFYARLRPGPDTGGALGYAVPLLLVGGFFAGAIQLIQGVLQRGAYAQLNAQLRDTLATMPPESREGVEKLFQVLLSFSEPSPTMLVRTPIVAVISFFVVAGLMHLSLMIVGGNKQGFTATLRAMAFAQGPVIFNVLPFCGALVAFFWTLVLNVMGLSALHRVGVGRVIGAYAILIFGLCCLCAAPIGVMAGMVGARAANGAHASAPIDVP